MSAALQSLYLALDVPTAQEAEPLVKQLSPYTGGFKVGSELFLAAGPSICDLIMGAGAHVFVDLKLHDIPRTVEAGAKRLAKLGARFISVHAQGGSDMLTAAVAGASVNPHTQVLAVTVLTSHSQATLKELGIEAGLTAQVLRLSELAVNAGVPGLVCSVLEVQALRAHLGDKPVLVTPGIRMAGGATHDQKRTATAGQAIKAGANVLVLGRAVLEAPDRRQALAAVHDEVATALGKR